LEASRLALTFARRAEAPKILSSILLQKINKNKKTEGGGEKITFQNNQIVEKLTLHQTHPLRQIGTIGTQIYFKLILFPLHYVKKKK